MARNAASTKTTTAGKKPTGSAKRTAAPSARKRPSSAPANAVQPLSQPTGADIEAIVEALRRMGDRKTRDGMARFAIPSERAFGVPVGRIRQLAKKLGARGRDSARNAYNHALAEGLWATAWYEARMLVAFLAEPSLVTSQQMDRWVADFDNWAICDTLCFHLFDRLPERSLAFRKIEQWAKRREEFVRRAAFALIASIALHDKKADDGLFADCFGLIEKAATDERNFVKKGVSWALRGIGHRSATLRTAAIALAQKMAGSADATTRWIGKDALRDLQRPLLDKKLRGRRES